MATARSAMKVSSVSPEDRKSTRLNSSHITTSYAVFCLKKKTEQRRFQVRLSHQPIHIYVSGMNLSGDRASFYVSTYYPDGTPAECHVNVSEDRNHYSIYQKEYPSGT